MASVKMPDGTLVELPDNPSQEQVAKLRQVAGLPPQQATGLTDQLMRAGGLFGRMLTEGVTNTGIATANALTGLNNLGRQGARALGLTDTPNSPMPSESFNQQVNNVFPIPKTTGEKVANFAGSALAGGVDPILNAVGAATKSAFPNGQQQVVPALDKTRQELMNAGYKLPPTEAGGGTITRGLEGIANRSTVAADAAVENQQVTKMLAAKALGLPEEAAGSITQDVLSNQAKALVKEGYDPVRKAGTIFADMPYFTDLYKIQQKFKSASFPDDVRTDILARLNTIARKHYDAGDAIDKISQLRSNASDAFRRGDSEYGFALRDMAKAIENNIERGLEKKAQQGQLGGATGSTMLDNYRAARVALAKNNAVEDMLADPNTGTISTVKAFTVGQDRPLTDGLDTIAKAGSPMFRKATSVPSGGKAPSLSPIDYVRGLLSTGIGFSTGHPVLGSALALAPAARAAARGAVLSGPVQNMMARNLTPQPSMFGPAAQMIGAGMPQHLLPLFSQQEQ